MNIRGFIVAGVIASWGLGGAAVADGDDGWVTLRISRVQVKPQKIDGATWDRTGEKSSNGCGLVGIVGKAAAGAVGGAIATYLCSEASQTQQGRDPSGPDLFVQVVAGDAKYRTPIASDTFAEAFNFSMIAPLDGVPTAGLEILVLDQDQDVGAGELVGMVRVTRRQLQEAMGRGTPLLTLADSQIEKLELEVSRYVPPSAMKSIKFEVNKDPVATPIRARAGELVTIRARGSYSVASSREPLDQNGYTNGQKQGYNRRPDFEKANHGAAIAYVGSPLESHTALAVGSCIMAVTPTSGQLYVGVNDSDVSNNQGSIMFDVQVSAPSLDRWRSGGAFACAERSMPKGDEAPAPVAEAPALPEQLDRAMITDAVSKVRSDVLACGSRISAKGTVRVSVTVSPSGGVSNVSIVSTPDQTLGDCVVAAMGKAVFPQTKSGGSFSFPFLF